MLRFDGPFHDASGKVIQPYVGLRFEGSAVDQSVFKSWVSEAYNTADVKVCRGGGKVWKCEIPSLDRAVVIRKYKGGDTPYWEVKSLEHINEAAVSHTAKRSFVSPIHTEIVRQSIVALPPTVTDTSISGLQASAPKKTPTKLSECIGNLNYLMSKFKRSNFADIIGFSVSMVECCVPPFLPYISDTCSEYIHYEGKESVTEIDIGGESFLWIYR